MMGLGREPHCGRGDHVGLDASPRSRVSGCCSVSSANIVFSCARPPRVDENTRGRPFGAQEAASLLPFPWVRARALDPSGLMAQRSNPPDVRRVKTMASPRGDHRGWGSYEPPDVRRRAFVPSASMTQIWGEPDRSEVKAISRPVGDQVGSVSMPRLLVSWRKSDVPTRSE